MKLNTAQIEQTLHQFESEAIPEDNPLVSKLKGLFGEHTYFLDGRGLNIVEPLEPSQNDGRMGVIVNLANWANSEASTLAPHEPQLTDHVVSLGTN